MNARRVPVIVFLAAALALAAGLAACGGSGGGTSSGSSPAALPSPGGGGTVTLWHGYTDVERIATDAFVAKFNATEPRLHREVGVRRQQRLRAAEAHDGPGRRQGARHRLPVRLVAGQPRRLAQDRRHVAAHRRLAVVQLRRLLSRCATGGHGRRQGDRRPGADRQPLARLQQEAVRRGRRRVPHQGLDLDRLPRRGQETQRPRDQAVRLGLCERRQRGHGVALPCSAVAGQRGSAQRGQHAGRLQPGARPEGGTTAVRHGGDGQVGVPRQG